MPGQENSANELHRPPGLECPQCGFRIQVTIEALLKNLAVCCSSCGLGLSIDREKSKPAIDALDNLHKSIEKVERIKAGTKTTPND